MTASAVHRYVVGNAASTTQEIGKRLVDLLGDGFYISGDEEDDDFRRVVKTTDLDEGNDGEMAFELHTEAGERYEVMLTKLP